MSTMNRSTRSTASQGPTSSTRVLYDSDLTQWTSKYVKTKRELDRTSAQCDHLRVEAHKLHDEVEKSSKELLDLESKYNNELLKRFSDLRAQLDQGLQQKQMLQTQLAENRRLKMTLTKEKTSLTSDYDRKFAELTKLLEQRGKYDDQLAKLVQDLQAMQEERKRCQKDLSEVEASLRENAGLTEELQSNMEDVRSGVRATIDTGIMAASTTSSKHAQRSSAEMNLDEWAP